jgi:hypothetical protein
MITILAATRLATASAAAEVPGEKEVVVVLAIELTAVDAVVFELPLVLVLDPPQPNELTATRNSARTSTSIRPDR